MEVYLDSKIERPTVEVGDVLETETKVLTVIMNNSLYKVLDLIDMSTFKNSYENLTLINDYIWNDLVREESYRLIGHSDTVITSKSTLQKLKGVK